MSTYSDVYYNAFEADSLATAREIAPLLIKLVKPVSVVDVGCGRGAWLKAFMEQGVKDVIGVDGQWVDKNKLLIPSENFIAKDLSKPLDLEKKYDLVVSVEVAEHLSPDSAKIFINNLTSLGPVVLFSAAIPFQGGRTHINEQWPEYWADIFKEQGYCIIDCIREKVWKNSNVLCCYAQNIFVFVKEDKLGCYPELLEGLSATNMSQLSLVHPKQYLIAADPQYISLIKTIKQIPWLIKKAFMKRMKNIFVTKR